MEETRRRFYNKIDWWKFFLVFIIPPLISLFLFKPFEEIELKIFGGGEPIYIPKLQINSTLSRSLLSEFFETSLGLGWYHVCFRNEGAVSFNGKVVEYNKDLKSLIPGTVEFDETIPGAVSIHVQERLNDNIISTQTLLAKPYKEDCFVFKNHADSLWSSGTSTIELGRVGTAGGLINSENKEVGNGEFEASFNADFTKLSLVVQNFLPMVILKTFTVFLMWNGAILLTRQSVKFVKKSPAVK